MHICIYTHVLNVHVCVPRYAPDTHITEHPHIVICSIPTTCLSRSTRTRDTTCSAAPRCAALRVASPRDRSGSPPLPRRQWRPRTCTAPLYIYIYIHLSLSIYIYIYMYMCISLSLYIYIYIYIFYMCVLLYLYIYIYIYIFMIF